ncbi:MAG: hypothetical protein U0903_00835 [Planctomycetales bacterium]
MTLPIRAPHSDHRPHPLDPLERRNRPAALISDAGFGRALTLCLLVLLSLVQTGCEVFSTQQHLLKRSAHKLPTLQPNPDTIILRVTFIERPIGDPLLGKALWKEVDEFLSNEDPEYQKNLIKNGFRVGVLSSFTETLQQLLNQSDNDVEKLTSGYNAKWNEIFRASGQPFQIEAGDIFPQCELNLFHATTSNPRETKTLESAHGIFQAIPIKEQEGWVRLELTPEFLHGTETLRPVVGESNNWDGQYSQSHEKLHDLRFRLHMNEGDTAIVTAQEDCPRTAGYYFFRGEGKNSNIQRAMIIRLVRVPSRQTEIGPQHNTLRLTSERTDSRPVIRKLGRAVSGTDSTPRRGLTSGRVSFP